MRFSFTEEQDQFRSELRRFLERHSPVGQVRRLMASHEGHDPVVWRRLGQELALIGIHVPRDYGGAGFGFVELSIAMEEMGRSLLCAPYFSSAVLATHAILAGASEDAGKALLPAIAAGERIAALAVTGTTGYPTLSGGELAATRRDQGYVLDGTVKFVLDGHIADVIIAAARTSGASGDDGVTLFRVSGEAPGLQRRRLDTLDATRKQAELTFHDVPGEPIGEIGGAGTAIAWTADRAAVALACEMVGGAQALLDAAVDYAKNRMQFGRVIGSFQAIKHRCADLLLQLELARSAACYAAAAIAEDDPEVPALASLAKATASDTYMRVAAECIQIHGGIGFTWDHDAHLWFKRAKSSEVLLGDSDYHRERYLQRVA